MVGLIRGVSALPRWRYWLRGSLAIPQNQDWRHTPSPGVAGAAGHQFCRRSGTELGTWWVRNAIVLGLEGAWKPWKAPLDFQRAGAASWRIDMGSGYLEVPDLALTVAVKACRAKAPTAQIWLVPVPGIPGDTSQPAQDQTDVRITIPVGCDGFLSSRLPNSLTS